MAKTSQYMNVRFEEMLARAAIFDYDTPWRCLSCIVSEIIFIFQLHFVRYSLKRLTMLVKLK